MMYVRFAKGSLIGAPGLIPARTRGCADWPFGRWENILTDTALNLKVQIDG